jgi:Cation efflux family
MTQALPLERRRGLHRRALRLEYFTVGWNVIEGVVAIGAGVVAGSLALVGFGVDSSIEVISAVGLLWRLRSAGPTASVAEESTAERRALYVVAATFFLLAAYITVEAGTGLLGGEQPDTSTVGLVLSVLSLLVMPTLAYWKQRTGREMGSRALVADAAETWVCSPAASPWSASGSTPASRSSARWGCGGGCEMGSRALVADAAETWVCSYLSLTLRIDQLHREADQARLARLARLARRHRRRVAVPPRRAAVPGRCPAPSRPAHQARSA